MELGMVSMGIANTLFGDLATVFPGNVLEHHVLELSG